MLYVRRVLPRRERRLLVLLLATAAVPWLWRLLAPLLLSLARPRLLH